MRPSSRWGVGVLLVAGMFVGAAAWQGYHVVVAETSTLEFCRSCHEMEAFVFPEYLESSHYSNASGVRAECADCHVPEGIVSKTQAKIRATFNEVPSHILGKIDTQEKFNEHKLELAERVWARMQASDSRACRNCHSYDAMSEEMQDRSARRRHSAEYREATGKTCIDCHKGIVHSLPESL
ncbi:MAG: NapC/NirT family cytochrome c [Wenzhouxiangellaceae bacterium]|nr:NapC/NirT family cytochrome c [Wenzhouxiangellaceae bacterium]